jgi:hypothetical protein
MNPRPDNGPTPRKTYTDEADGSDPMSTDDMPPDDFDAPRRGRPGASDPFPPPNQPGSDGAEPPPARPMEDEDIPGAEPVLNTPVRQRTFVQARYRLPRVARLDVEPQATPWLTAKTSRLANR